jgi:hypothetical protein
VFAVIFAVQAITFALYSVPAAWSVTHTQPWPRDTLKRSYFTSGLCAGETGRACSGPNVPIPRQNSPYEATSGRLAYPAGARRTPSSGRGRR